MKIWVAAISQSRSRAKSAATAELTEHFVDMASKYVPCESLLHPSEAALLSWVERLAGRTVPHLILLDSRGRQFSSEEFATHLGGLRDSGCQTVVLSIGPADGWSKAVRDRAGLLLSLGRMTLPQELAKAVVAEQVYRALTILAGHPYHCGH